MAKVDVFGTKHVDRPSKVREELEEFADDADILFSEEPQPTPTPSDKRGLFLRNPTIYLTGTIVSWLWAWPGFFLTGRFSTVDVVATENVAQDNGLDIKPVDLNLHRRASDVGLAVTVLSWIWFALVVILFVLGLLALSSIDLTVAFAGGFLPVFLLIRWTLSERDETMAENIEEILSMHDDLDRGCLVVGNGHSGVAEELEERGVEVGRVHKSKFFRRNL